MNRPVISIIVIIYNTGKYLHRCLENLVNQTFKDIEIICIIDGSSDNSLEICKSFADKDPRLVIVSQENQGRSRARDIGLIHAKGKYIQFCDSDDYYELDMCEKLHGVISSSNAELATAGIRVSYEQCNRIPGDEEYYRIKGNGLTSINELVFRSTDVSVCNKIFKKSIIDEYNINFPPGLYYEDACFFLKYLLVSRTIYYIPEQLYNYKRHKENSIMAETFQKSVKALDHVKLIEDIKGFMKKNDLMGCYEIDVFLWIIITGLDFVVSNGTEDIFEMALKIVSDLLADIHDEIIISCPYITKTDVKKLIVAKNNDVKCFFKIIHKESERRRLRMSTRFFLPAGSKRRELAVKLYSFLRNSP